MGWLEEMVISWGVFIGASGLGALAWFKIKKKSINIDIVFVATVLSVILITSSVFGWLGELLERETVSAIRTITRLGGNAYELGGMNSFNISEVIIILQAIAATFWMGLLYVGATHTNLNSKRTKQQFLTEKQGVVESIYNVVFVGWLLTIGWVVVDRLVINEGANLADFGRDSLSLLLYLLTYLLIFSNNISKYYKIIFILLAVPEIIINLVLPILGLGNNEIGIIFLIETLVWDLMLVVGVVDEGNNPQIIKAIWIMIISILSASILIYKKINVKHSVVALVSGALLVATVSFHMVLVNIANQQMIYVGEMYIEDVLLLTNKADFYKHCKENNYSCTEIDEFSSDVTNKLIDEPMISSIRSYYLKKNHGLYTKTNISINLNEDGGNIMNTFGYYKNNHMERFIKANNITKKYFDFIKEAFYALCMIFSIIWIVIIDLYMRKHTLRAN
jgi:hypothetical protein